MRSQFAGLVSVLVSVFAPDCLRAEENQPLRPNIVILFSDVISARELPIYVSQAHREEKKLLKSILPRFEQVSHGTHGPGLQ